MFIIIILLLLQEFESVCCILAAVLNIGDIRLETNFHSHIGEVSFVQNSERVHDGKFLHCCLLPVMILHVCTSVL